jgi:hypothetical protein
MNAFKSLAATLVLGSLSLVGCSGAVGESEEATGEAEQASVSLNSVSLNSVSLNSVSLNSVSLNSVSLNSVSLNSVSLNGLDDPSNRKVWEYVVGCALPAGQSVTVSSQGVSYTWNGQLGLAPQWSHGPCDESCQEWVSACVLARVDYAGVARQISLRGDKPGLATSAAERATYYDREATYYGNIFSIPQRFYACLSPGKTEIPRVCGPSVASCGFDVVGSCDDVCGRPRSDGSFPNCSVPEDDHGCGHGRDRDDVYHASITVFLRP